MSNYFLPVVSLAGPFGVLKTGRGQVQSSDVRVLPVLLGLKDMFHNQDSPGSWLVRHVNGSPQSW